MLRELRITDLILIDKASVCFEPGFTVISGETGSGKSAILEGIHLLFGARTDPSLIRHGSEKGVAEAVWDLSRLPAALKYLEEKGIDIEDPERVVIKREIALAGKTKAYIDHQPVQLALLKELKEHLLELVTQSASHQLFELDQHREFLDLFGALLPLKKEYEILWHHTSGLLKELSDLKGTHLKSTLEMERCSQEIQEIEEANLREGEEEELFEAYSSLATAKERAQAADELISILGGEKGILSLLNRARHPYSILQTKDPHFAEKLSLFPQVILEVEELLHELQKYSGVIETDPHRQDSLNHRLATYNKLKKKYGVHLDEVFIHLATQKNRLHLLQNLDSEIENLTLKWEESTKKLQNLANKLSSERKQVKDLFKIAMEGHLTELNMPHAQFHIEISPIPLTSSGGETVEFFLHSNVGEKPIPLRDGASGGEIARVLLAIHLLLAGKEGVGTLVFDEVDANIGGKSAAIIGNKLKNLGKSLQVICITHFPQVAAFADHHLHIAKSIDQGRTFSQIASLSLEDREKELLRMSGK